MNLVKKNKPELTNPVNLERDSSGRFDWSATNGDPQLTITNVVKLSGHWVRLCMVVQTDSPVSTPVVVYENSGNGFSESSAHYLIPNTQGRIDFSWYLHEKVIGLRLDPVAQIVRFSISGFNIQSVTRAGIVWNSLWRVSTLYPGGVRHKFGKAVRLLRTGGLRATLARVVAADSELARNPALGISTSSGEIARQRQDHPERLMTLEKYTSDGFARSTSQVTWNSHYVPKALDSVELVNLPVKIVAFYLPQFHPFPENDLWWGKGFTEWTNVSKAQPQYDGHHQPRLPGELGFYDLRLQEVMRQQIDLAHHYGVTAFCFHHYWFGGKRLMERPVNQLLADSTLKMDFCICWANENWTRRWDGAEHDVLISQKHSPDDDIAFFEDILPALKDQRYIRVDGKPLLIVYRASLLPDAKATASRWRELALMAGLPGLYLVTARAFEITDPRPFGFDAAVEFPPHQVQASEISSRKTMVNPNFSGKIYDYRELAEKYGKIQDDRFTNFKTVMPSWDNEARKPGKGHIFDGATPQLYARWLTSAANTTLANKPSERLVFINAWNEWAEGAHLEPDRHYGYAYLHATANVLRNLQDKNNEVLICESNHRYSRKFDSVVILHLYYDDLIDEIFPKYLTPLQDICDLIVTVRPGITEQAVLKIKALFPNVYFIQIENRGRDIRPFLSAFKIASDLGYLYVCKLHSKKSPHLKDGSIWRDALFSDLVKDRNGVKRIIEKFESNEKLGLLAPKKSFTSLANPSTHIDNREWLDKLLHRMGTSSMIGPYDLHFPAGSMYWVRVNALRMLLEPQIVDMDEFEFEAGQRDGTLAHSIERLIGLLVEQNGFISQEISWH